jgi:chaperonin GroES
MKLVPLKNRILAKRKEPETTTKSGLIIPSSVNNKPNEAEVLAVGAGRVTESGVLVPVDIVPGNVVIFNKHAGNEIQLDGETFLILHENDIIAVIE